MLAQSAPGLSVVFNPEGLAVEGEIAEASQPIPPLYRRDGPLTNGQRIDSTAVG